MKIKSIIISLLFSSASLFAGNPVEDFTTNPLLENANISLLVKDLRTGETLYKFRPKSLTTPASTMKLVTTSTVLELFGPEYRFETKLMIDGNVTKDSVLNGNLYVVGGGDPTLGSEKLGEKDFFPKWIRAVRNAGIKKISGRVIADESFFESQVVNPKWTWEEYNYRARCCLFLRCSLFVRQKCLWRNSSQ